MDYRVTNLEYGICPWETEVLYGGIGNPKPGETERGKVIVGGDIACRPANVFGTGEWPGYLVPALGRSGSARMACEAYGWIREMTGGDASRLVLTHDVTMHERFETEGRKGLAVHHVAR